jgi:hypothetical protein
MAFAFRKGVPVSFPKSPRLKPAKVWLPARARRTEANRKPNVAFAEKARTESVAEKNSLVIDLGFAEQLANKRQLEEAAKIRGLY